MELTAIERETIINFNEEEDFAEIYTHNTRLKNRIKKFAARHPDAARLYSEDKGGAAIWHINKNAVVISLRKPISDEAREAYRRRSMRFSGSQR